MTPGEQHLQAETDIWVVRAGIGGVNAQRFLDGRMVTIGWGETDVSPTDSDDKIKAQVERQYPQAKPGTRSARANQLIRFLKEVAINDTVATYVPENRLYHIGIVRSNAERLAEKEWDVYTRNVEWQHEVSRDALTAGTRNSLGSAMALFRLSKAASEEIRSHCRGEGSNNGASGVTNVPSDESDSTILADYSFNAEQLVEDQMAKLDWSQFQELVAGILRAMGYQTKISPRGRDRGVDVFASPDGLGLAEPRIFVEVKHRQGQIGASEVRSFLGGRKTGDRCLYVSTGGFSMEARYEADRSSIPLTLVTISDLRELLLNHYENLDSEIRALVPLKRVYLPISE